MVKNIKENKILLKLDKILHILNLFNFYIMIKKSNIK